MDKSLETGMARNGVIYGGIGAVGAAMTGRSVVGYTVFGALLGSLTTLIIGVYVSDGMSGMFDGADGMFDDNNGDQT